MTPLHHIGEAVRQLFLQVPLGFARVLFILLLAGLLVWVLTLPKTHTISAKDNPRPSEDLKFWAALSLLIQILIYAVL